jgi:hypothetical protein
MNKTLQVREILETRGLTLHAVSRRSAEIFDSASQFYIPHKLYYSLAHPNLKPTIHQIFALSHITDYRLSDWLAVFGFDLDAISRLQLAIPRKATTILDSTVHDTQAWIPWFGERAYAVPVSGITPLGRFLAVAPPKRARVLLGLNRRNFLYARIGERDLYAVPHFVSGSIVRADTQLREAQPPTENTGKAGRFFLLEHQTGWTCSQLMPLGNNRVLLLCPQRPCAERELQIGRDARVLGLIDAEIRPVGRHFPTQLISNAAAALGRPRREHLLNQQLGLRGLLQHSRMIVGLSFREASSMSRLIANSLSDQSYFAAPSTLSDYETLSTPPRHIEKIITLCLLYGISFEQFFRASGLPLGEEGREPIPDALVPRQLPSRNPDVQIDGQDDVQETNGFLGAVVNQWEEIPLFLRFSLNEITGQKSLSLSDLFWVAGVRAPRHPLLLNATLAVVNRRARKPSAAPGDASCEQSLYVIMRRDGTYLCGPCTLQNGSLIVHHYRRDAQQFRNGTDAEVVGQVTSILRKVS